MPVRMYRVKGHVSAIQWTGSNGGEIAELLGPITHLISDTQTITVTKNGRSIQVPVGHWLLRLSDGEYATCSQVEFREIYEELAD